MQLIKVQYENILVLENIHKKPLHSAPKGRHRMLPRLPMYHVINIIYVPGREMYLADALSRAYEYWTAVRERLRQNLRPITEVTYLAISAERLSSARAATKADARLQISGQKRHSRRHKALSLIPG